MYRGFGELITMFWSEMELDGGVAAQLCERTQNH